MLIPSFRVRQMVEHYFGGEVGKTSRYAELFGTPERAARTLAKACGECSEKFPCSECPLDPIIGSNVYEPEILEWLRGDAEWTS